MAVEKLFTVAGITTHRGATPGGVVSERTKVRFGTDMIRLVKMLNSPKKIEDKRLGITLAAQRVELVDLPEPLTKAQALEFLRSHEAFQSPEDQYVIQEAGHIRAQRSRAAARREVIVSGAKIATTTKAKTPESA